MLSQRGITASNDKPQSMARLHAVQETYRLSSPLPPPSDSLSVSHSYFLSSFFYLYHSVKLKYDHMIVSNQWCFTDGKRIRPVQPPPPPPPPSPSLPPTHDTLKSMRPFPKESVYGQFPLLLLYPYSFPLAFSYPSIPSIS